MLALFSVLWNANNVVGVIAGPIVLAVVIVVAFKVSYNVCSGNTSSSWFARRKYLLFFLLSVLFFTFLGMGTINAVVSQSKRDGELPRGVSQYPPGVVAASSFVLFTFSSFVIPYYYELRDGARLQVKGEKPRIVAHLASMWAAMSLVSKIILLAAFGAGAQVQTDMLAEIEIEDPKEVPQPVSFNVDLVIVGLASSIVLIGIAFFWVSRRWLNKTDKGHAKQELLLQFR